VAVGAVAPASKKLVPPGYSPFRNLVLWYAHSLFPLFCIHLRHFPHFHLHSLLFGVVGGKSVVFIIVCIMLSTLLLVEVKSGFDDSP
jgi:hypothetical protein